MATKEKMTAEQCATIIESIMIPHIDSEIKRHQKAQDSLDVESMLFGYEYGYEKALKEQKKNLMRMLNAFKGEISQDELENPKPERPSILD